MLGSCILVLSHSFLRLTWGNTGQLFLSVAQMWDIPPQGSLPHCIRAHTRIYYTHKKKIPEDAG